MKKRQSKTHNLMPLFTTLVMVCILLLSIGFSAFQASMEISDIRAIVRAQADIRVTGITVASSTNGALSSSEEYNVKSINSNVYLPNQDSTITYNIKITNTGNVMQGIYSIDEIYKLYDVSNGTILNTNSNLEIKNALVLKEALCDDIDNSKCKLGSNTTLAITIGYKTNGFDNTNKNHAIELDFDFRRVFGITYNGFSSISGLPTQMIYGDNKTVTFTSTTGIPSHVSVSGATGSYTSPTLTLSNVTITAVDENIVVTRKYSITYSGFTGNTSGLISSISATGGTITFDSTTGIPTNVTVTGATGSYNSSTHILTLSNITGNITITATNGGSGGQGTPEAPYHDESTQTYNPDDVPANSTILYEAVDGAPQVSTDENGNVTKFEYTDINQSTGISVPSGGLDTGVLAFDGNDFVVTLKAKFTLANCTASICPIINVSKKDPTVNGVLIYELGNQTSGYGHTADGTNVTTPFNKFRYGKYENSSSTGNVDFNVMSRITKSQSNGRYGYNASSTATESKSPVTLTIKLYCTNGVFTAEIYNSSGTLLAKPYNNTSYSFTNIGSSFDDVTIVVGQYDGFGSGVSYSHNFDILEFSVVKSTN